MKLSESSKSNLILPKLDICNLIFGSILYFHKIEIQKFNYTSTTLPGVNYYY